MAGLLTCLAACLALALATDPGLETAVAEGRAQYEMVKREGSRPRFGACWVEALRRVETGCKELDDEVQSRLALGLANCFLEKAGQRTYPCPEAASIASCLEGVDSNAFTAYTDFFTHTQNMCFFLQSQVWQEDTEATIVSLASNSAKVSETLEESHQLQQQLVSRQEESLQYHRQLADGIVDAKGNVREMLEEFKLSTFEQKTLIFEVFDRVSRLQNLVVSEVSWLYTVIFYAACLLVIYLVTATRRTADARLWLFVILTANFAAERLVVRWSLPQAGQTEVMNLSEMVNDRVWLARQAAISLALLVLGIIAWRFKDYNKINNALLEDIKKQNLELRSSMESFQVGVRPRHSGSVDLTDSGLGSLSAHLTQLLAEDTGFNGDEEDFSDDDADDSLNSSILTDVSYRPGSRELSRSLSSEDDYGTAQASRETTPVNQEIDSAMEALGSCLVTSTGGGLRSLSSTPLKAAAPAGALIRTPPRSAPTPPRYNLRRTPGRTSNSSSTGSSILQQESPEAFAKVVSKQLHVTKRNAAKWSQALKRHDQADFSSDEQ